MTQEEQPVIGITTATLTFKGHKNIVSAVAVFPDRRRIMTALYDKTLRLWNLEDSVVLKKMKEHRDRVRGIVVSRAGQWIASGNDGREIIVWNRDGECLTESIKVHFNVA